MNINVKKIQDQIRYRDASLRRSGALTSDYLQNIPYTAVFLWQLLHRIIPYGKDSVRWIRELRIAFPR